MKILSLVLISVLGGSALANETGQISRLAKGKMIVREFHEEKNASGVYQRVNSIICEKSVDVPVYKLDGKVFTIDWNYTVNCDSRFEGKEVRIKVLPVIYEGTAPSDEMATKLGLVNAQIKYFGGLMYVMPTAFDVGSGGTVKTSPEESQLLMELYKKMQASVFSGAASLDVFPTRALVSMVPTSDTCVSDDPACKARLKFEATVLFEDKK